MKVWQRHCNLPIVGLTGSISSGKTHVAKIAKSFGFQHLNTDDIAKRILVEVPQVQEWAHKLTGIHPVRPDGCIEKAFGVALFSNPKMLGEYESFIHPMVFEQIKVSLDSLIPPYPKGVLLESAIWRRLEEVPNFDSMWVVEAPNHLRVGRFLTKNPEGADLYSKIELNQQYSASTVNVPMFTIINDGRDLHQEIEKVCNETINLWTESRN